MSTNARRKGFIPKAKPIAGSAVSSPLLEPDASKVLSNNRWQSGLYWFLTIALFVILFGIAPGNIHPYNKAFYLIVLTATFALIGLWWAVGVKALKLVTTPFFIGVGVWLLAKLIATITSMLPAVSFWGTYEVWADGFVYALAVATIAAVIVNLRLDTKRIARLVHILGIPVLVFATMTIYQAVQEGFFYQKVRPDSPLLNADYFLSFSLLFWPLAIVLLVINLRRREWVKSIPYALSALILSVALFVTLPTHLQTILLPGFMHGKKDTTSGAMDTSSINASNFTEDTANMQRWAQWGLGLKLGSFRPLVGTGPSTTGEAFIAKQNQLDLKNWDHDQVMQNSHNDLIEQFSQEGLIGLAAYIFLWGIFVWVIFKNRRRIEPGGKSYALGIGLGLLVWFGFNQLLFTTVFPGLIEWVWIALLLSLVHAQTSNSSLWLKLSISILSIGLVIISIFVIHAYIDDGDVFHAESINLQLKRGEFNNLSPSERASLSEMSAAQQDAAADDLPYVAYYANDAALSSIDLYIDVQSVSAQAKQLQASNALKYAHQAVNDDPYSPSYVQTLGGIEYYLAPAGSSQEISGISLMNKAIRMTPEAIAWYGNAAQISALKGDYSLARSFIARGLRVAHASKDRMTLNKIAATFPAP